MRIQETTSSRLNTPLLALVLAMGLGGCGMLPDQRLANEALKNGDTATAERNFRQLADLGYVDAQVGLADLQMASGSPEALAEAEKTYRMAMDESPRAKARLGKLLVAKPNATSAERHEAEKLLNESFATGEESSLMPLVMLYLQYPQEFPGMNVQERISTWRQQGHPQAELAQIVFYRTQGIYEQHLGEVERICQNLIAQDSVCYVELATVYQVQEKTDARDKLIERMMAGYHGGSVSAQRVDAVARVIADADLGGKPDEGKAQELLEEIAPSYPAAWVSLAQLLYDYPGLGDSDKMMSYLDNGRAAALPRAELLMGRLYYEGKLVPQDPQKAEEHLRKAAPSEPTANYFLGQIYMRGYLGDIYPQKALDHLLSAARAGNINADFALGQMYSQGKGFQPDLVNAYVFSQLALPKDTPQAHELATTVSGQLTPEQHARGDQLLREERQLRGSAWQRDEQLNAQTP